MRLVRLSLTLICGLAVLTIFAGNLLAQDHQAGTWKRNPDKSKYDPGPAPTMGSVRTFEDRGGGLWVAITNAVPAEPTPRIATAFKRDGKDYPLLVKGVTAYQVISFRKVGSRSWEYIVKTDGKAGTTKSVETFSADGKTYTVEVTGMNQQGKPVHNVEIWEKQ